MCNRSSPVRSAEGVHIIVRVSTNHSGVSPDATRRRVLMVAACPFPARRGTPVRIERMAEALGRRGHEVHVATYHLGETEVNPHFTVHRIRDVPGYQTTAPGPNWRKLLLLDPRLQSLVYKLARTLRPDVIHAHHFGGAAGRPAGPVSPPDPPRVRRSRAARRRARVLPIGDAWRTAPSCGPHSGLDAATGRRSRDFDLRRDQRAARHRLRHVHRVRVGGTERSRGTVLRRPARCLPTRQSETNRLCGQPGQLPGYRIPAAGIRPRPAGASRRSPGAGHGKSHGRVGCRSEGTGFARCNQLSRPSLRDCPAS